MLKRLIGRFASVVAVVAALAGCGDSPSQTGDFATVEVTLSSAGGTVVSDVSDPVTDSAAFILTSTAYTPPPTSSGGIVPSRVAFISGWVTLVPANSWTPALPESLRVRYFTPPASLAPNSSLGISVELVTPALKEYLRTLPTPTTANPYQYWATVSFQGVEVNSDREETISTFNATTVNFTGFE